MLGLKNLKNLKIVAPLLISKALKEDSLQRKKVNAHLARLMARNGGMWQKLGQMLSVQSPKWEELQVLASGEDHQQIPKEDFRTYIESLFEAEGFDQSEILSISDKGMSASLSQVHEIRLKNSNQRKWVIKAKLPGIEQVIEDQLKVFQIVALGEKVASEKKSFSTKSYLKTFKDSFSRELDYQRERRNLEVLRQENIDNNTLIPALHHKLQGSDFIIMEKMEGESWDSVIHNWSAKDKRRAGHALFDQFIYQYFIVGLAQGDFHPGNFLFKKNSEQVTVSWIDLGQSLTPGLTQRKALFSAIQKTESESIGNLFYAWGFDLKKLSPLQDRLPLILQTIFSPLMSESAFYLSEWKLKEQLEKVMGQDKWWFRTAGSSELFVSIRCWLGLQGMLEQLKIPLHLGQIWREATYKIEPLLDTITLEEARFEKVSFSDMAKTLKIEMTKGEQLLVNISLPALAIDSIAQQLSSEVQHLIKSHSIDLEKIIEDSISQGLKPQVLVDVTDNEKHILVSLI